MAAYHYHGSNSRYLGSLISGGFLNVDYPGIWCGPSEEYSKWRAILMASRHCSKPVLLRLEEGKKGMIYAREDYSAWVGTSPIEDLVFLNPFDSGDRTDGREALHEMALAVGGIVKGEGDLMRIHIPSVPESVAYARKMAEGWAPMNDEYFNSLYRRHHWDGRVVEELRIAACSEYWDHIDDIVRRATELK